MPTVLSYARDERPNWLRPLGLPAVGGAVVVVVAGAFSTLMMRHFRAREGMSVLDGLANTAYYMTWIEKAPGLAMSGAMVLLWLGSVIRCPRGGRVMGAIVGGVVLAFLWSAGVFWLASNSEAAFP